jgi:hypothetical protein
MFSASFMLHASFRTLTSSKFLLGTFLDSRAKGNLISPAKPRLNLRFSFMLHLPFAVVCHAHQSLQWPSPSSLVVFILTHSTHPFPLIVLT